jgi:hypothetical protein
MIPKNVWHITAALLLFFSITVLILISPFQQAYIYASTETNAVRVISHNKWIDMFGQYHVSGEVENVGNTPLNVKVTAIFYDSKGNVIATRSTSDEEGVILKVLLPRRKSPFDIVANPYLKPPPSELIDHYELNVTCSSAESVPIGLKILSSKPTVELITLRISGMIKNIGNAWSGDTRVIASFYASNGVVCAVYACSTSPGMISPGDTAVFTMILPFYVSSPPWPESCVVPAVSYSITAESVGYTDRLTGEVYASYAVESEECQTIFGETLSFKVSNLAVSPKVVRPGEPVKISVEVKNEGKAAGSYTVNLKVNGTTADSKTVTLKSGEVVSVTFEVVKEVEGNYEVTVDGAKGSFKVSTATAPPSIDWLVITAVISIIVVAATASLFYLRRVSVRTKQQFHENKQTHAWQ